MEHPDAAARPSRHAVLQAQHEGGPMEPLHHAAGDNSHHARVPALSRKHQRGVIIGHRLRATLLHDRACYVRLGLLPLVIQVVELRRQCPRPRFILRQK